MHFLCTFIFLSALGFISSTFGNEIHCPLSLLAGETPRYNMTASHQHKFVWFRVAKVGTRTILSILKNHFPLSVNDYSVPYNRREYEGFFKFAFVRNPWSRVVSCYCNKVLTKSHPSFAECYDKDFTYFVDYISRSDITTGDPHIKLQTKLLPINDLDFIGRFENFAQDLRYVLSMLNISEAVIEHKNSSKSEHYSRYYNERTKNIIAFKYKADIRAFGYEFEYQ